MTLMRALFLVLSVGLLAGPGWAQPAGDPETVTQKLDRWDSEAKSIERRLRSGEPELRELTGMRRQLEAQLGEIPAARKQITDQLKPLQDQRTALGDAPEEGSDATPQIAAERERLDSAIAELEAKLKRIDQAKARAEGLAARLTELRRTLFTNRLMTRGPSVIEPGMIETAVGALSRKARVIVLETETRLDEAGLGIAPIVSLVGAAALLSVLVVLMVRLRNRLIRRLAARVTAQTPRGRRIAIGAGITLTRLVLPTISAGIVFGAVFASGLLGGQGTMLAVGMVKGVAVVIGAYALGGAFFAPNAPELRLSLVSNVDAVCAHRWLIVLAAVVGLDRAFVQQGQEMGLAVEGLALLSTAILILGGLTLWKFLRHIRSLKIEPAPETSSELKEEGEEGDVRGGQTSFTRSGLFLLRLIGRLSALAAPLLAVAGYYVAARFAFFPVLFSGAVIGLCVLLYHLVRTLVDSLAATNGESDGAAGADRLRLIPIGVGFLLFCAALPVLALIWGADIADLGVAWRQVVAGFPVGEVTISPLDFVLFATVLVVGVIINRRVNAMLRRNVLPLTGLDQGGRDAVAAGAGYIGVIVVTLIAISSAGIDLSNIALVAGALSVGIGFGLQNIVNNFVSGIILLIERPIKAGDWIQLPTGMGYVKTINVRSTEVETFDRSTLFVPNSQLIAEQVINWTHSNLHGRVIVAARVAHGSDPRLVERILLEIARAHPLMLRRPAPFVLLRAFAADAMEFEIRGILRDVNWVLNVHSDINFEIARRFAEEGIEIPFSQTDIHLRDTDALVEALGGRRRANGVEPPVAPDPGSAATPRTHSSPAGDSDAGAGEGR